jgi:outer membrane protein TolC
MKYHFKKSAYILITLFLSLSVPARGAFCEEIQSDNSPTILSLEKTIHTALENNRDIQIQSLEVAVAKANIVAASSNFLPALSMGYGFTYTESVLTTNSLPERRKDTRIFTGYRSDNYFDLSGKQMIYDGGASIANLKEARVRLKIQDETLRAKKLEIEFEAKRLFYGILFAHETLRIAQNLVDQAEEHYKDVKAKYEQGTSSRFDVLQSRVQISKLIPELIRAKNSIEIISAELKKLLYLNIQEEIKLTGRLNYLPIDLNEFAFLGEAYSNSPQMHLKKLGVDLNKWAIELAKSGYYPNINANTNYFYRSDKLVDMFNPRHYNWSVGISGTVSIFDGMSTKAKIDAAKSRYAQALLSQEDIREQIAVDIKRGCLDAKQAHAIILSQKDNIKEASEALKISYISYDNGVGINLDVIDSQVSLSQVENNLASGIYDYIMAKAFLDKVMGREYAPLKEE